jgi:hypothetical protein
VFSLDSANAVIGKMDPLSALGLASNIVQFVDFTSKLISTARGLYKGTSGTIEENWELEKSANAIRSLADDATAKFANNKNASTQEATLRELGNMCRGVADELLSVLQTLKVKGSHKKWESFYQALKSERKHKEISALEERLNRIGNILSTKVLSTLLLQVSGQITNLYVQNQHMEASRSLQIDKLSRDISNQFGEMEKVLQATHESTTTNSSLKQLSEYARLGRELSGEQQILNHLRFDGMDDRHANIRPAHTMTFPWLFQSSTSPVAGRSVTRFVDWMVSEDRLYWISGKPGSGKSTLMKYAWDHDLTRSNLGAWARNCELVITNFFFWAASRTELPKSQEGLLRSILYQILRRCPDLIPHTFPTHWHTYISRDVQSLQIEQDDLKLPKLVAAFGRISSLLIKNTIKFCFFIDGLDEYSGKPNEIIPLIETLCSSPHIKICLSSRPWNEFEKIYGQSRSRKLYMEEFNKPDIERYVRDTLEKDVTYRELQEMEDTTPDLVKDVVDASSGVFLWVYLVVQSLLDGLTNEDSITNLQRRLRHLPRTLKEFFKSIFNNIDEFYMEQTAHIFLVTIAAYRTLPLLTYWFIEQEDGYAIKLEVQPLSMQKTNFRLKQMRKRINACCKGLLEVQFYDSEESANDSLSSSVLFQWKVDFLHRTVRDFLMEKEMQDLLNDWAKPGFDVDFMICEAILAQIKTSPQETEYHQPGGPIEELSTIFRYHSVHSIKDGVSLGQRDILLDEFLVQPYFLAIRNKLPLRHNVS